jgi:hypothetical protein
MVWSDARLHEPTHKRRPPHFVQVDAFGDVRVRYRPCRQTTPTGVRRSFDPVGTHGGNGVQPILQKNHGEVVSTVSPHGHDTGSFVFCEGSHERVYESVHLL